ncbi:periplasmic chaperone [Serratia symbiotica str. 'Cinara cedri']|nr:periplasmic chaperone [Serratia symbiotica str. 'Cinara cedri']
MKKWLCAPGLSLVMTALSSVQAADKIAVVNVSKIFQQLPASEAVAKQLENEFKERANELQNMEYSLQTKMQQLHRDSATMKLSDRSKLEKEVIIQREQFSNKAHAFEQDNRSRQMEERNKILNRIQDMVKVVASKGGYDIVIDVNAVAYVSASKDITADVLKQVK